MARSWLSRLQSMSGLLLAGSFILLGVVGMTVTDSSGHRAKFAPFINAGSIPQGTGQSRNWSGYVATGGSYTSVAGTWTIPALVAGQTMGSAATWVGIGGVNSQDLIQAGTEGTVTRGGTPHYDAWIETLPQSSRPVALTVKPGDSMSVSLIQQSTGSWLVHLNDNTTGQSVQKTIAYASSLSSAEWIEEAPSSGRGELPLANFGAVQFTGGSTVANGASENLAQAGATAVTLVGASGQIEATPSTIGTDGASFSVTWGGNGSIALPAGQLGLTPMPLGWGAPPPWIIRLRWRWAFGGFGEEAVGFGF